MERRATVPYTRRQATAVCGAALDQDAYNLALHIGALFIILAVSALACGLPSLILKYPRFKIPPNFLFGIRHFGTGVLIATAFAHLLPTAFTSLTDPCLPAFWNDTYPAMAGVIAMAATFVITSIEMVFSGRQNCVFPAELSSPQLLQEQGLSAAVMQRQRSISLPMSEAMHQSGESCQSVFPSSMKQTSPGSAEKAGTDESSSLTPSQETERKLLQCCLLELGILFHSVFIGMALAVAIGDDFVVLLIAIVFHQTFEGLALGSRIAAIDWTNHPRGKWQPWVMALAYGCTTPLGQAIGMGTRSLYDPASQTGLLVVGIMNSISSGLLIFAALVELLAEDFLSEQSWKILRGRRRMVACMLVVGGAFLMSLIGAWA